MPKEVLELPILGNRLLTVKQRDNPSRCQSSAQFKVAMFGLWWFVTIALGAIFLIGTGNEWQSPDF